MSLQTRLRIQDFSCGIPLHSSDSHKTIQKDISVFISFFLYNIHGPAGINTNGSGDENTSHGMNGEEELEALKEQ